MSKKQHWEKIYSAKQFTEVSWYQEVPVTSLEFIKNAGIRHDDAIIDVGGGDSFLADKLLDLGYTDITVLDISEKAIERAKARLGNNAGKINWIINDITEFIPQKRYRLWHDRAAFHFLTNAEDIEKYRTVAGKAMMGYAHMIIGTFSEQGPEKCSGINIRQYSEDLLTDTFKPFFLKQECKTINHTTPFNTSQNFVFCRFRKI